MRNTCRTCGSVRTGRPAHDPAGVAVGGADPPGDAVVVVEHREAHRRRRVGAGDLDVEQVLVVVERPARQPDQGALVERVELRRGHHVAGLGGAGADLRRDARAEQLRQRDDRGQAGGGAGAHPQPQGAPLALRSGGPPRRAAAGWTRSRPSAANPAKAKRLPSSDAVPLGPTRYSAPPNSTVGGARSSRTPAVAHAELGGGETGEPGQHHRQSTVSGCGSTGISAVSRRGMPLRSGVEASVGRLPSTPPARGGDLHREQRRSRSGPHRAGATSQAGGGRRRRDQHRAGGGAGHQL